MHELIDVLGRHRSAYGRLQKGVSASQALPQAPRHVELLLPGHGLRVKLRVSEPGRTNSGPPAGCPTGWDPQLPADHRLLRCLARARHGRPSPARSPRSTRRVPVVTSVTVLRLPADRRPIAAVCDAGRAGKFESRHTTPVTHRRLGSHRCEDAMAGAPRVRDAGPRRGLVGGGRVQGLRVQGLPEPSGSVSERSCKSVM